MKKLVIALLLFLVAGCSSANKITILDADTPDIRGLGGLRGEITLDNGSRRDLVVKSADFTLRYRNREIARARLVDPVWVPARSVSEVNYTLKFEDVSLSALQLLRADALRDVRVDVEANIKWGGSNKKIKHKNVSVEQIIDTFAR